MDDNFPYENFSLMKILHHVTVMALLQESQDKKKRRTLSKERKEKKKVCPLIQFLSLFFVFEIHIHEAALVLSSDMKILNVYNFPLSIGDLNN